MWTLSQLQSRLDYNRIQVDINLVIQLIPTMNSSKLS